MAARRLQLFAQREWANELSSFSIEISGEKLEQEALTARGWCPRPLAVVVAALPVAVTSESLLPGGATLCYDTVAGPHVGTSGQCRDVNAVDELYQSFNGRR